MEAQGNAFWGPPPESLRPDQDDDADDLDERDAAELTRKELASARNAFVQQYMAKAGVRAMAGMPVAEDPGVAQRQRAIAALERVLTDTSSSSRDGSITHWSLNGLMDVEDQRATRDDFRVARVEDLLTRAHAGLCRGLPMPHGTPLEQGLWHAADPRSTTLKDFAALIADRLGLYVAGLLVLTPRPQDGRARVAVLGEWRVDHRGAAAVAFIAVLPSDRETTHSLGQAGTLHAMAHLPPDLQLGYVGATVVEQELVTGAAAAGRTVLRA